jgi:sodium/proline symporter
MYFSILVTVGIYSYLTQTKGTDFLLGHRSLNYWITAIATNATDMSLWLFMGYPAFIYTHGLSGAWICVGLIIGMFLTWHYIAPALRSMSEKLNASTITEFFNKRFHDTSGNLTIASATFSLIFFTYYISSGIVALGRVFSMIFELNYVNCITLGTGVTALYTFLGGFLAVELNNFLQGMFILTAIIIVPTIAFENLGSITTITQAAITHNISLELIPDYSFTTLATIMFNIFAWGLSCFGQLHILINFMAINKTKELSKAKYISTAWQITALAFATLTGIIGLAYFKIGTINPELIFITLTKQLFNPFFAGLILCAILAAGISTMAIQILLSASTIAHDLFKTFIFPKASERQMSFVYRYAIFVVSIISWYLALDNSRELLELVKYAWTGLGCTFGPIIILSLYGKNITRHGALAGILTGGCLSLASPWLGVDPKIPFAISFIAICLTSAIDHLKIPNHK